MNFPTKETKIDTPVIVWQDKFPDIKHRMYYAGKNKDNECLVWHKGKTSWSVNFDGKQTKEYLNKRKFVWQNCILDIVL